MASVFTSVAVIPPVMGSIYFVNVSLSSVAYNVTSRHSMFYVVVRTWPVCTKTGPVRVLLLLQLHPMQVVYNGLCAGIDFSYSRLKVVQSVIQSRLAVFDMITVIESVFIMFSETWLQRYSLRCVTVSGSSVYMVSDMIGFMVVLMFMVIYSMT